MNRTSLWVAAAATCFIFACRTVPGMSAAGEDSSNSSAGGGSGQNSSGSNQSSNGSGQSSNNSGQSSNGSSNNSNGSSAGSNQSSQNSNASSKDSGQSSHSGNESAANSNASSQASTQATTVPVLAVTGLALTAGTVGLIIWGMHGSQGGTSHRYGDVAYALLRANEVEMQQDFAIGSGPFIEDLAETAEIPRPHLVAFGRALHTHRIELLDLAAESRLTPERALMFLQRVGEVSRDTPELASDYQAFAQRHPHEG